LWGNVRSFEEVGRHGTGSAGMNVMLFDKVMNSIQQARPIRQLF